MSRDPSIDNGTNVLVRFHSVARETDAALLLSVSPEDDGTWVPKSQVAHIDQAAGEVWMPLWIAVGKGFAYE